MNEEELKEYEMRLRKKEEEIKRMESALEKEKQEYVRMAMEREKRLQEQIKELEEKGMKLEGGDVAETLINYQRDIIALQEKIIRSFVKRHPEEFKEIVRELRFTEKDLQKIDTIIKIILKEKKLKKIGKK